MLNPLDFVFFKKPRQSKYEYNLCKH